MSGRKEISGVFGYKKGFAKDKAKNKNMARTLDSRYFRLVERKEANGFEYQAYQTVYPNSTMVLFSTVRPDCPIAALSFLPRYDHSATTVLTRRMIKNEDGSETPMFHGLSNVDNGEIKFVITNLTDFVRTPTTNIMNAADKSNIGYLKLDILANPIDVREVDHPNDGINQVNELRPSESCVIQTDQRSGHYTLRLREFFDPKTQKTTTVDEEDAKTEEKKQGMYFYINVLASELFPEMVQLLETTTWRAVDVFVRRIPKDNGRPRYMHGLQPQSSSFGTTRRALYSHNTLADSDGEMGNMFLGGGSRGGSVTTMGVSNDRYGGGGGGRGGGGDRYRGGTLSSTPMGVSGSSYNGGAMSVVSRGVPKGGGIPKGGGSEDSFSMPKGGATPTRAEIGASNVGRLERGNERLNVTTSWTGHRYAYDTPGERMRLGLSVWRDLRLLDPLTKEESHQEALMQLEDALKTGSQDLLQTLTKVFVAEECVVCMANTPQVVFFQCGHKCVCNICMSQKDTNRCYMCRAPIVATVQA